MKRPEIRPLLAVVTVAALGVLGPAQAALAATPASVQDFTFESFNAEYFLSLDADGLVETRVVETIVAVFPDFDQNRGIVRSIPTHDNEVPLDLEMISVTDEAGNPVYYEREDYDSLADFPLGTDEYVHGRQTYVLEYELHNTIRHFEDSGDDEFYWDINGTGWPQPFESVSATVHLSDELAGALTGDVACYQGYFGESDPCELEQSEDGTTFEVTAGPLGGYSTVTVAIGFEGGTVTQPTLPREHWIVAVVPNILLGLLLLIMVGAIGFRLFVWRDAAGRGTIVAQYERPEGVDVVLAANIIGHSARAFPALLIDLAVRGVIHIVDSDPGSASRSRYKLELVNADNATGSDDTWLKLLFSGKRTPGKRVTPGSFSAAVGAKIHARLKGAKQEVSSRGYRTQPESGVPKTLKRVSLAATLAFLPVWVWAIGTDVLEDTSVVGATFLAVGIAVVTAIVLARPSLLTEKGAAVRDHLLGIREYLTVAEEDRIRMLQSPEGAERLAPGNPADRAVIVKLYERLLPFAVLWGIEDQWIEQLKAYYPADTPEWLEGRDFDAATIRSFSSVSTSTVRPMPVASSSSGSGGSSSFSSFSSGSSGGGFSGGGGGGGGGGGR